MFCLLSLSRPTLFGESLILLSLNMSVNSYNSATFEDPSVAGIVENIFKKIILTIIFNWSCKEMLIYFKLLLSIVSAFTKYFQKSHYRES